MSHDDDLAMVKDLDALRARMIESNDPEDCRLYLNARWELDDRLNLPKSTPEFGIMEPIKEGAGATLDKSPGVALSERTTEMRAEYTPQQPVCEQCGRAFGSENRPRSLSPRFCSYRCFGVWTWKKDRPSPEERLLAKVSKDPRTGCWNWTGYIDPKGYGTFWLEGQEYAHRAAYRLFVGPIPEGMHLDHLCRNRRCVNPEHLEPVTCKENIMRGESPMIVLARKNQCSKGHTLTPENVYIRKGGGRVCKTCNTERNRARDRKGAVAA